MIFQVLILLLDVICTPLQEITHQIIKMGVLFQVYPRLRILYVFWMYLESVLFAGVIYGWSSFVFIFKEEGIYAHLCDVDSNITTSLTGLTNSPPSFSTSSAVAEDGNEKTTQQSCVEQDSMFNLAFTVSTVIITSSTVVAGYMHYKFGITVVRVIAMFMVVSGYLMVAFLNPGESSLVTSFLQIANLFTTARSTVLGLLSSTISVSSSVSLAVKIAFQNGIRRRDSFLVLCALQSMIFISTFFFLPRKIIHKAESMNDLSIMVKIDSEVCEDKTKSRVDHDGNKSQVDYGVTLADGNTSQVDYEITCADGNKSKVDHGVTRADGNKSQVDEAQLANGSECAKDVLVTMDAVSISKHVEQVKDSRGISPPSDTGRISVSNDTDGLPSSSNKKQISSSCIRDGQRSLKSCLLSAPFILHVLWTSVLNLRALYFIQTLNPWLNFIFNNDKSKVSYYTDAWLYITMGSILTSLLAGAIHDWQKKLFAKSLSVKRCQRMPYVLPLSLTTVLGVCLSILMFVPLSESLYATFIDFMLLRSFLYTMTVSFLNSVFPTEYCTVLLGCLLITMALLSSLQYALFEWVKATSYDQVNLFLVFLVCVAFLHPAYQWYKSRQAEFKVTKQQSLDGEIK
ncbi:solute carrier family 43 member 3-like isoform X3 [Gigantopelta aegis]|uniref:solute carrier family 43 member 3-like isoform X3 n=1 Tax=Gigantopelta aegis TaxID=1735272 RepID=UPI001B88C9F7|nr:solute carrier family 43 member 3-like isoform X3 [Gigantopelta aegis]